MYGLVVFFIITLWLFFIESYSLENALQRGCVYSFWIFLYVAFYNSYKLIVNQLPKILITKKLTFLDIKHFAIVIIYIVSYWIQVLLVTLCLSVDHSNIIITVIGFILISITFIQIQMYILTNEIINVIKK